MYRKIIAIFISESKLTQIYLHKYTKRWKNKDLSINSLHSVFDRNLHSKFDQKMPDVEDAHILEAVNGVKRQLAPPGTSHNSSA